MFLFTAVHGPTLFDRPFSMFRFLWFELQQTGFALPYKILYKMSDKSSLEVTSNLAVIGVTNETENSIGIIHF